MVITTLESRVAANCIYGGCNHAICFNKGRNLDVQSKDDLSGVLAIWLEGSRFNSYQVLRVAACGEGNCADFVTMHVRDHARSIHESIVGCEQFNAIAIDGLVRRLKAGIEEPCIDALAAVFKGVKTAFIAILQR
jgi:hypothetical protein